MLQALPEPYRVALTESRSKLNTQPTLNGMLADAGQGRREATASLDLAGTGAPVAQRQPPAPASSGRRRADCRRQRSKTLCGNSSSPATAAASPRRWRLWLASAAADRLRRANCCATKRGWSVVCRAGLARGRHPTSVRSTVRRSTSRWLNCCATSGSPPSCCCVSGARLGSGPRSSRPDWAAASRATARETELACRVAGVGLLLSFMKSAPNSCAKAVDVDPAQGAEAIARRRCSTNWSWTAGASRSATRMACARCSCTVVASRPIKQRHNAGAQCSAYWPPAATAA